jgi:hypothetical protein
LGQSPESFQSCQANVEVGEPVFLKRWQIQKVALLNMVLAESEPKENHIKLCYLNMGQPIVSILPNRQKTTYKFATPSKFRDNYVVQTQAGVCCKKNGQVKSTNEERTSQVTRPNTPYIPPKTNIIAATTSNKNGP